MEPLSKIQRAARLARIRSSQGVTPFADTFRHLQMLKVTEKGTAPVIAITEQSSAIFVGESKSSVVFSRDDPALTGTIFTNKTTFTSDFAEIWFLPEQARKDKPSLFSPMRSLTMSHLDNPTALAYMSHAAISLDFKTFNQFCSRCGSKRVFGQKECPVCKLERYPRQSPCAITLVYDPKTDSLLCGQRHGSKFYSFLAGFAEALESVEDCAVREIFEESQVTIDRSTVEMAVTQPWPFLNNRFEGTSLIVGCLAETTRTGQVPVPCAEELAAVKWFPVEELRRMWTTKSEQLPMQASMARFLLQAFLDSTSPSPSL